MKRINWLDTTRGLAFLMVIYSHLFYRNDDIMKFFSPVFLTTFFFVSGYLFKEHCSFSKVLEQRTRTILLPFLTLGGVMILLSNILTFNEKVPILDEIKGLLFQNGENQLLWFVAALYVYSIVFYWVERLCKSNIQLLSVCVILFLLNVVYSRYLDGPSIPWHISSMGYAIFYMGLGKLYRYKELVFDSYIRKWHLIPLVMVYVAIIYIFDLHISFAGSDFAIDAIFITVIGLVIMIYLCKWYCENNKLLLFVGSNSLFYFAFHGKVYSLLQTIVAKILSVSQYTLSPLEFNIMGFLIVLLDALILIVPTMFVNRYIPQILGKGFKLWKAV